MSEEYHPNWQKNRIKFLLSKYDPSFFEGKTILELGPYNGYIGEQFRNIGASVTCVEGRNSNIHNISEKFPNLTVILGDLDTSHWNYGKYDIIINFGVFYHLEKHHSEHLENCIKNCNIMFFESVIFDSFDSEINYKDTKGDDQSLSGVDGTPSQKYIEDIFIKNNCNYSVQINSSLNGDGHMYDWVAEGDKKYNNMKRRFWIVENT
jgi:hypothetical protein